VPRSSSALRRPPLEGTGGSMEFEFRLSAQEILMQTRHDLMLSGKSLVVIVVVIWRVGPALRRVDESDCGAPPFRILC
jgi:hypothetical protein